MSEETKTKRKYTRKVHAAESIEARMAAVEHDEQPVQNDGPPPPPMLTQAEIHKLRLFEAEARHSRAEAETCRMRKKWILSLLDPKGTVEAEEQRQEKWLASAREFAKKYELAKAHASMRLGLDLDKCGFDPETGLVVPPDSATGSK